jgi:hypothetical protein
MIKPVHAYRPDLESLAGKYTFRDPYRMTPAEKISRPYTRLWQNGE